MDVQPIQKNRSGLQSDHCCMCDRSEEVVSLHHSGASLIRFSCLYCDRVCHVLTQEMGYSQKTHPQGIGTTLIMYQHRMMLQTAAAHDVPPKELAQMLVGIGAFK